MSKTKKWTIWIIILVVIIGAVVFYIRSKKPVTTYTSADVTRGTLAQTVSVTGDLMAQDEITLNFELGGRVSKVYVKKNDKVAAGDKIAILTDSTLQKQLEQARAGLEQAIAQTGSSNDALREAKVAKENAENTLTQTKSLNDQSVTAAEKAVESAQKYYDDSLDYYNSSPSKQLKVSLTAAENSLNGAKESLKVANEQSDLSKVNAESAVETVKAKIKTIESEYSKDSENAQVAGAKAAYDIANLNLARATLISPVNGIITEVNNKPGEILGTGVIKESFSRVMSLDLLIESKIPESDIVKVKLGQKAKITFDSLTADDIFEGEIIEIDPASTTIQDVVYYVIKLKLNNVDLRIKPGMSANVDVSTSQKDNVIIAPLRAVKTEGKKKFVDVLLADSTIKKVYVETGLEGDDGMVEIKSGLSGGEKVVTFVTTK
jgi:HlyD family secretion protein